MSKKKIKNIKKNNKKIDIKKAKKRIALKLSLVILGCLLTVSLFFLYGPYKGFSDFWITTAMRTSSHQYLAKVLYPSDYINKVLNQNRVIKTKDVTNTEQINSNPKNDAIVIKNIKGKMYTGYLMEINNPKRVSLVSAKDEKGEALEDIVKRTGAIAGINASGYKTIEQPGIASLFTIENYQVVTECDDDSHQMVAFDDNNNLIVGNFSTEELKAKKFKAAIEFGPILIVNGQRSEILGNGGGLSPRTAIGQTKEGVILLLVIDGRQVSSIGASLLDVQNILFENGAINAANLDGGASSSMVYNGKLVNKPSQVIGHRLLPNAIIIK